MNNKQKDQRHRWRTATLSAAARRRQGAQDDRGENMAVDSEGRALPYSPAEVRSIVERALDEGTILAAIIRMPSGDLAVQVMGPPSVELLEVLEQTTSAYRVALRGH